MVITISGLSFIGYVATRWLGTKRGLLLGAALGGLVSSTAVTLAFANRTKRDPALAPVAAGAITVAWMIMLCRVAVLVAIVDPMLLRPLAFPLAAMLAATTAGLLLTFRRKEHSPAEVALDNPFELWSAIKVSLVFGAVLLVSKSATVYLGDQGLYLASALGGTTDVDAVTLSSARLAVGDTIVPEVATVAITIAICVNTIVKTCLAAFIGGPGLGKRVVLVGTLTIAAAGVAVSANHLLG